MLKKITVLILIAMLAASMTACKNQTESSVSDDTSSKATVDEVTTTEEATTEEPTTEAATEQATEETNNEADNSGSQNGTKKTDSDYTYNEVVSEITYSTSGMINGSEIFTSRDLTQNADLTDAVYYTLTSGSNINITSAGVYVLTGEASNVSVTVDAGDDDKVQLVLDGAGITNSSAPAIYVKNADKVFVTTASDSVNNLSVTGSFSADGTTNTDAVIFSKDDLVINGLGTLNIKSSNNGVTSKDDLKITGGTLNITSTADALEANDSIAIAGGDITINASSDGIQATTIAQIDGGNISVSASEGIEGTFVQINGGTINISASDDGINASSKSTSVSVAVEINSGDITVNMGQGDTDGIDSNGNIIINGGTIRVNAQSPFDYDGTAQKNGGTIYVNGTQTDAITNQMMGGMGGMQQGGMPQNNMQQNNMQGRNE